jgi:hypothetical protein
MNLSQSTLLYQPTLSTLLMAKPLVDYKHIAPYSFNNKSNIYNTNSSYCFSSYDNTSGIYNNVDFLLDFNQFTTPFGNSSSFGQSQSSGMSTKRISDTSGLLHVDNSLSSYSDLEMLFPFERCSNTFGTYDNSYLCFLFQQLSLTFSFHLKIINLVLAIKVIVKLVLYNLKNLLNLVLSVMIEHRGFTMAYLRVKDVKQVTIYLFN